MKRLLTGILALACSGLALAAGPIVEMRTNQGTFKLQLDADSAPETVANFVEYAASGFYDGTIFHRVIDGFMIQGGGFDGRMQQKPTRTPIRNEAANGLRNEPGTIAMARTRDPHSASSQFFINLVANRSLDYPSFDGYGYAVFGQVTEGFEVVQGIAGQKTQRVGPHENVPVEPVIIESVRIVQP